MSSSTEPKADGPYLLTGASGWFGKTALWEYEHRHGPEALRNDVVAFASKAKAIDFGSPHGPMPALPLSSIAEIKNPRGLIHLAFLTRDQLQHLDVESYIATNRAITDQIKQLIGRHSHLPMITTSSGAAAGVDSQAKQDLDRNPYAWLKQEEESLWRHHAQERMAMVFRVYAASGRFLKSPKLFAIGDFVAKALNGEAIVIRSHRPVLRSYVHVGTLMRLCWALLRQPLSPGFQQIDACTDTLSLIELAERISSIWCLPAVEYELDPTLSPDSYIADGSTFRALLQRYQITTLDLDDQIRETARWLA
ncbi:MAG: NAD-dependent epimerase/dehydratase family protein [Synechococcaceae cyanobacterium]|jgi:nucleoside-diphosphate-sugar epimerase